MLIWCLIKLYSILNSFFLKKVTGSPCLDDLKVTADSKEIIFYYNYDVSDISQKVHIHWSKDGKALSIERDKYFGGGSGECLLKIKSPNSEDIGKYTCTVVHGFGSTSHAVTLGIVNFFITLFETFIYAINLKS